MSCAPTSSGFDRDTSRRWERRLEAYYAERRQGNQPRQTTWEAIVEARRVSDATGKPFGRA